jgi:hypothetical protein
LLLDLTVNKEQGSPVTANLPCKYQGVDSWVLC